MDKSKSAEQVRKANLFVLWLLWAIFQVGVCVMYYFLSGAAGGRPTAVAPTTSPTWLLAAIPVLISCGIRWFVLPKLASLEKAKILFIVGLVLSEMTNTFGLFFFPAHRLDLFVIAALGILQYIPFFAAKYDRRTDEV